LQNGLVRNQIVALEYETDGMVAVGVPVPVFEVLGRSAVDDQVTFGVLVETADDVQHGGLSAAGRSQDRDKLVAPKTQVDAFQRMDCVFTGEIVFFDAFQFQHIGVNSSFSQLRFYETTFHVSYEDPLKQKPALWGFRFL
jgi:hypothetical protein